MTSPATPQPCNHCKGTGNEPEAGFADSPCDDCNGTGAASPATPALEQAIQKLADQFSRWGKSKTNTNDSLTEAWSFVAEQLKKALADVARLHTPQARDRWTCTGCPQVVIGCKPTWTHSFTHKHEWVSTP